MAGRFLSLEEAARQLGVTADEVNRLVDRKKLFPMRDGAVLKFKADDVERAARDLAEDSGPGDDLSLDLDLPAGGGAEAISLEEEESIFDADSAAAKGGSQTIIRGGAGGASRVSLGGEDVAAGGSLLDGDDLSLDSIIAASSPSLAGPAASAVAGGSAGSGLTIDLGDASPGSGMLGSGAGAALSGVLDSGLSLEDNAVQVSGIDLGAASGIAGSGASLVAGGSGLGGDAFELGADTADDESASVVIATEETGDSSFFGAAIDGEGSTLGELSEDLSSGSASVSLGEPGELVVEMPFSGLQIAGLVCCSLLLLAGGFVMFDLVRTIGSAEGPALANPLLDSMAEAFGWR